MIDFFSDQCSLTRCWSTGALDTSRVLGVNVARFPGVLIRVLCGLSLTLHCSSPRWRIITRAGRHVDCETEPPEPNLHRVGKTWLVLDLPFPLTS